ncbi:NAD(P)-dependent dehydrogenase (short-subunit alcohol dehydrogenase family) [Pelomonas aquatica]|uniref:NAD(P)-dependent dehydrogenase (Short-subunit alcohol dehydrogenase family) n=1 Tax=Pelomonas aquatica TaxID=431058 RepID=A0ABU1Z822_9BURK|nr:glucose 1-dehydrogenase [Pelomonas aquatica]MDR7296758.1 NAD(P)-dependent dehydrogenase (short-subunit alcohol dehydrogenase family) [Pelomonas aquatica]
MTSSIVLITGALTGIGRATALAFAKEGATVVVSGRREPEGQALVAELKAVGAADAAFIRADVREEADVRTLVEQTVTRFGRLDVAVNNAGVEGATGPITEQGADNYDLIFDSNVRGVLFSLKHEMRAMLAQGGGAIVNLSSVAGLIGFPGASVYVASKHAVEGLTKSAALEGAAAGVRVNAVAPGPIQTDMLERFVGRSEDAKAGMRAGNPAQRFGTVDEVAQTIVFLASDKARYLTGQSLAVDGGFTAQ